MTDLTEYQKQKFRDLSSKVNLHISNQKPATLDELLLIAKQAIPYSLAPIHASNYSIIPKPFREQINTDWVESSDPTMFENLIFHVVLCLHDLFSNNLETYEVAYDDWFQLNDLVMSYVDGSHWDTYLSDIDKLRELKECLTEDNLKKFLNVNNVDLGLFFSGDEQLSQSNKHKLDVLHRIFEQASYSFEVSAFVSLWFTTPDELTNLTPLEFIRDEPQEAKSALVSKLKNPVIPEN